MQHKGLCVRIVVFFGLSSLSTSASESNFIFEDTRWGVAYQHSTNQRISELSCKSFVYFIVGDFETRLRDEKCDEDREREKCYSPAKGTVPLLFSPSLLTSLGQLVTSNLWKAPSIFTPRPSLPLSLSQLQTPCLYSYIRFLFSFPSHALKMARKTLLDTKQGTLTKRSRLLIQYYPKYSCIVDFSGDCLSFSIFGESVWASCMLKNILPLKVINKRHWIFGIFISGQVAKCTMSKAKNW